MAEAYVLPDKLVSKSAPSIVGVITLVGGVRKEFNDYVSFYAAKAFYARLGAIVLALVGVEVAPQPKEGNPPVWMSDEEVRAFITPQLVAKAA